MKFFERHRWPTFEGIMMILIVVISVFSFVYSALLNMLKKSFFAASFTADNKLFSNGNSITWNIVMGTGMT
ncbi:MAG: hypothetical protein KKC54_02105 [Nanoarchaeota archaeon]|nr:hypothetical protein [Nanoarchaeota archaeon]MBU1945739.1 hypothetical protein [Nanoarchaeota archaeon]